MRADLHVNYWKLPKRHASFNRFLDFGLLIHDVSEDLDTVSVYIPFKITSESITDLGEVISDDKMLGILFNGYYRVANFEKSNSYYSATCSEEGKEPFLLYTFKSNFRIDNSLERGVRIEIPINRPPQETPIIKQKATKDESIAPWNLYLRFRIEGITESSFGHTETISNDWLQSAFSKMEMFNLHINEYREIPVEDSEIIHNQRNYFLISKVHFYFIGSSEDEKVSGQKTYKDTRLLDGDSWEHYINGNNPQKKKCIAYHWKYVGQDVPSNIFIRSVFSSAQGCRILKYFLIILFIGFLGSLFATVLYETISDPPVKIIETSGINDDSTDNSELQLLQEDGLSGEMR